MGDDERRSCLAAAADAIKTEQERLASRLTAERGKPLRKARLEVPGAVAWFRCYANLDLAPSAFRADDLVRVLIGRRARGTVADLTPWNFPLVIGGGTNRAGSESRQRCGPQSAVAAPRRASRWGQIAQEMLPPGVFNVVTGDDYLASAMASHPHVLLMCCTEPPAARRVRGLDGAYGLSHSPPEPEGNNPAVVLEDAEPDLVAAGVFAAAFFNNGQVRRPQAHLRARTPLPRRHRRASRAGQASQSWPGEGAEESSRIVRVEQFGPAVPILTFTDVQRCCRPCQSLWRRPRGIGLAWGSGAYRLGGEPA